MTWRLFIGVLIGALLGYVWHRAVGCRDGACPIVGNPWTSTMYGMIMGGLMTAFWQ